MTENSTVFQDAVTINWTNPNALIVKGGVKIEGILAVQNNDAQQYFVGGELLVRVSNAQYAQLLTETGTTSASYVVRWNHTTGSLPAGRYMVMFYYECRTSGSSRSCDVQIPLDNTTVLHRHRTPSS
ncbi:hypothetical protein HK102_013709 [Quaeritorhiza haematococci]|nr:hypothetical protein HK102_013709 [Quaeritorhiza haematococci]